MITCHRCGYEADTYREMALHFDVVHEPEIIEEIVQESERRRRERVQQVRTPENTAPRRETEESQ